MTDADLRALFDAWLRDRGQVHKLAQLQAAQLRAFGAAAADAAVRTAYPPQVRTPAITHAEGSPLRHCQDDFGRRHAARLDRREAWERGPIIPRRTEDRA